jgi:hypothetical protein
MEGLEKKHSGVACLSWEKFRFIWLFARDQMLESLLLYPRLIVLMRGLMELLLSTLKIV